jgi:hypothetical protein
MFKTQSNKLSFFFAILFYSVSVQFTRHLWLARPPRHLPSFMRALTYFCSRTPSRRSEGPRARCHRRRSDGRWRGRAQSAATATASRETSWPGAPLHRLWRLHAPPRRLPQSHCKPPSGQAQGRGRARLPGRRRGTRTGPAPPRQVRRVLRWLPRHCGPAFVILLALGTQRQERREHKGHRLVEPLELGLGASEHHEGTEADQLLVQQEHHGRANNHVNATMHARFASWVDRRAA